MIQYKLNKVEDGVYYYYYYPQMQMDAPGLITITEDGQRGIIYISDADVKNRYAGKVWNYFSYTEYLGSKEGVIPM